MTFLLAIVVSFAFGEESKKEKCPHGIKYRNIGNHFFQLGRKEGEEKFWIPLRRRQQNFARKCPEEPLFSYI